MKNVLFLNKSIFVFLKIIFRLPKSTAHQRQERAQLHQERARQRQERAQLHQERAHQRQERAQQHQERAQQHQERAQQHQERAHQRQERAQLHQERAQLHKETAQLHQETASKPIHSQFLALLQPISASLSTFLLESPVSRDVISTSHFYLYLFYITLFLWSIYDSRQ